MHVSQIELSPTRKAYLAEKVITQEFTEFTAQFSLPQWVHHKAS